MFNTPDVQQQIARINSLPDGSEERLAEVDRLRAKLDIPDTGPELRAWIRWCLQRITNKDTKRVWTQADVGREATGGNDEGASGATVSRVFVGELPKGELADKVRDATARIIGLPVDVIFRPSICPECGNPLLDGDHDTGSDGRKGRRGAVRWSPRNHGARAAHRHGSAPRSGQGSRKARGVVAAPATDKRRRRAVGEQPSGDGAEPSSGETASGDESGASVSEA